MALAKTKTISGQVFSRGDPSGTTDLDPEIGIQGSVYPVKAHRIVNVFDTPTTLVTGDGDARVAYENSGFLYGRSYVDGLCIAASAIGILGLITHNTDNNSDDPGDLDPFPHILMHQNLWKEGSNVHQIMFRALMERLRIVYNHNAASVRVQQQVVKAGAVTEDSSGVEDSGGAYQLMKPHSFGSGELLVSSDNAFGNATGDTFQIDLTHAVFDFWTDIEESTGDEDDDPDFEASQWLHGSARIRGWLPANSGDEMGVASMIDADGAATDHHMQLFLSKADSISGWWTVERHRSTWTRRGGRQGQGLIPVELTLRKSFGSAQVSEPDS